MLNASKELLTQSVHYRTAKLPLGEIAGTDNGYCDVIYERFDAQTYPAWITQLRQHQSNGSSCTLLREFDLTNINGLVTTKHRMQYLFSGEFTVSAKNSSQQDYRTYSNRQSSGGERDFKTSPNTTCNP